MLLDFSVLKCSEVHEFGTIKKRLKQHAAPYNNKDYMLIYDGRKNPSNLLR
jgi:hypothetical protein